MFSVNSRQSKYNHLISIKAIPQIPRTIIFLVRNKLRSLSEINDFLEKQYNSYFLTRRNDEIGKINVMSEESGSINELLVKKATTQG